MPFPPSGFVDVATDLQRLTIPRGEGRYRTIAGRAYYGAYWATCQAVCRKHQVSPAESLHHVNLCEDLASIQGDESLRHFGDLLNGLRLRRIHADYNLPQQLREDTADQSVEDAQRLMQLLPRIEARLPWFDSWRKNQ